MHYLIMATPMVEGKTLKDLATPIELEVHLIIHIIQ